MGPCSPEGNQDEPGTAAFRGVNQMSEDFWLFLPFQNSPFKINKPFVKDKIIFFFPCTFCVATKTAKVGFILNGITNGQGLAINEDAFNKEKNLVST